VTHTDKLKKYNVETVCMCHVQMPFHCPACGHDGPSSRAIRRHALSVHRRVWLGPETPLQDVPPDEAQSRLQRLNRNSTRRRRWRDRQLAAQDVHGGTTAGPGGRAMIYGLTARPRSPITGALPAGAESSSSSESGSVEGSAVPELLVGYLQDLDIDPDPWVAGRQPELRPRHQPERPRFRNAAVGDGDVRMEDRGTDPDDAIRLGSPEPELRQRHQPDRPQARDAAENDRSFRVVDRGTDPDDAIRLGFPGRVDPRTLAGTVLGSPVVPVATVAHMLAPPPVDPDDYRAVRYAVEAVAAAEAALCYDVLTGLHGAYWAGGLPRAIQWVRDFLGVHMARPQ